MDSAREVIISYLADMHANPDVDEEVPGFGYVGKEGMLEMLGDIARVFTNLSFAAIPPEIEAYISELSGINLHEDNDYNKWFSALEDDELKDFNAKVLADIKQGELRVASIDNVLHKIHLAIIELFFENSVLALPIRKAIGKNKQGEYIYEQAYKIVREKEKITFFEAEFVVNNAIIAAYGNFLGQKIEEKLRVEIDAKEYRPKFFRLIYAKIAINIFKNCTLLILSNLIGKLMVKFGFSVSTRTKSEVIAFMVEKLSSLKYKDTLLDTHYAKITTHALKCLRDSTAEINDFDDGHKKILLDAVKSKFSEIVADDKLEQNEEAPNKVHKVINLTSKENNPSNSKTKRSFFDVMKKLWSSVKNVISSIAAFFTGKKSVTPAVTAVDVNKKQTTSSAKIMSELSKESPANVSEKPPADATRNTASIPPLNIGSASSSRTASTNSSGASTPASTPPASPRSTVEATESDCHAPGVRV